MDLIRKTKIPPGSLVEKYLPADYTDAYSCEVRARKPLSADDIMVGFWAGQTGWTAALFRLRHFLVRFVGLQGSEGHDPAAFEKMIREGGNHRIASVAAKNDHETVLLLSDKHLDAWMSVYVGEKGAASDGVREKADEKGATSDGVREKADEKGAASDGSAKSKTIFVITVVKFHNRLGRVYFFVIRPFHALIVKKMLRKRQKALESAAKNSLKRS